MSVADANAAIRIRQRWNHRGHKLALRHGICTAFSMVRISTHALDTLHGCPAAGMRVILRRPNQGIVVADVHLNADGRPDDALFEGMDDSGEPWELEFDVGSYFREQGVSSPFLDLVPVRFRTIAAGRFHVPLVCSPWAYQTYRGS
jgi:5-hydroxyisourate hydrolase